MQVSRRIIISIVISAVILVTSYIAGNSSFPLSGGPSAAQRFEQVRELVCGHSDRMPSDIVAVNVAYDRQLVDFPDEYGFTQGNIDVTDRRRLLWLLQTLAAADYRAVIFDIGFDSTLVTDADSLLYAAIASMPRVYVARTSQCDVPQAILGKARYSEYGTTIEEGNFTKYDFMVHGEPALPLAVCGDLYGTELYKAGPLYLSKGHIGRRAASFPLKSRLRDSYADSAGVATKNWYNLGADLMDTGIDVAKLARGKIVVVGDFCEDDIHDTYLGPVSGPAIIINAIEALRGGVLEVSWTAIVILLVIYAAIAWCLLSSKDIYDLAPPLKRVRAPLIRWMLSGLSLGVLFACLALAGWLIYGGEPDVVVPTLIFSIIVIVQDILKLKKDK